MNSSNDKASGQVEAQLVGETARLESLPKHFGRYLTIVESMIYDFTRRLVPEYKGAYWHFYELSNGGFYMAPDVEPMQVHVDGNGFGGQMSADAIGITVCLFTFSHGSFQFPDETFARHYQQLRDYSYFHPERQLISAAID